MLTAELNAFTKFAAIPMRDYGNEAGADNVMSWLAGYPFGIDFTRGYPRSNPGEFTAVDLLVRKEADAAAHRRRRSVVDDAAGGARSSRAHSPHRDRSEDHARQPGGRASTSRRRRQASARRERPIAWTRCRSSFGRPCGQPHGTDEDVLRGIHDAIVDSRRPPSRALWRAALRSNPESAARSRRGRNVQAKRYRRASAAERARCPLSR